MIERTPTLWCYLHNARARISALPHVFPAAAIAKHHRLGHWTQKSILSQSGRPEVRYQGVAPSPEALESFLAYSSLGGCLHCLPSSACGHTIPISTSIFTSSSPLQSASALDIKILATGSRSAQLIQDDLIISRSQLNYNCKHLLSKSIDIHRF